MTNIDFSGINVFWKVMEKLEKDELPGDDMWQELFSTPGYRTLLAREFSPEFFKEKFSLAFMPSKAWERRNALKSQRDTLYLPHYIRVQNMKSLIVRHLDSLDASLVFKKALQAANSLLPSISTDRKTEYPNVSFIIFENDARGYDPIVIDALASMEWGDISLFLGHEFHHFFRNKLPFTLNFLDTGTIEACLVNIVISIESEGIADLINMDQECSTEPWTRRRDRYERLLELVPESIRYLDDWVIHNYFRFPEIEEEKCKALYTHITDSGHQVGYYMAKAILRHFSKENLIAAVGKPFSFLRLYQEAAEKEDGSIVFSEKVQKILSHLESKYTSKTDQAT